MKNEITIRTHFDRFWPMAVPLHPLQHISSKRIKSRRMLVKNYTFDVLIFFCGSLARIQNGIGPCCGAVGIVWLISLQ